MEISKAIDEIKNKKLHPGYTIKLTIMNWTVVGEYIGISGFTEEECIEIGNNQITAATKKYIDSKEKLEIQISPNHEIELIVADCYVRYLRDYCAIDVDGVKTIDIINYGDRYERDYESYDYDDNYKPKGADDSPYYNENLDLDQQSQEFWDDIES